MRSRRARILSIVAFALVAGSSALSQDGAPGRAGPPPQDLGASRRADAGPPPGTADGGSVDPDEEIIDHLDELQRLELLQNLELFDPKADEEK